MWSTWGHFQTIYFMNSEKGLSVGGLVLVVNGNFTIM